MMKNKLVPKLQLHQAITQLVTLIGPENDDAMKVWAIRLLDSLSRDKDVRNRIATTSGAITQLVTLIGPENGMRKGYAIRILFNLSVEKGGRDGIANYVRGHNSTSDVNRS